MTLEDLLEEIVGEIEDEYDMPDDSVQRIDEQTVRVDGTFPIDDFNEQFGQGAAAGGLPHACRLRLRRARAAPETGDEVTWDGLRFEVVETDGPRIELLEIEFLDPASREPSRKAPEPAGQLGQDHQPRVRPASRRPRRRRDERARPNDLGLSSAAGGRPRPAGSAHRRAGPGASRCRERVALVG